MITEYVVRTLSFMTHKEKLECVLEEGIECVCYTRGDHNSESQTQNVIKRLYLFSSLFWKLSFLMTILTSALVMEVMSSCSLIRPWLSW